MVFLTQKILRVFGGGHTFLLITDRTELDAQIYGTFAGVGAVNDKNARATDGENLKELLKTDKRYVFSLIHKFNFDEKLTDRDNIIVISDEAHRTQAGTLAMNMRKALPNASFIGFTGTPLFKDDELTKKIFGEYVSKYDFKRSIEDGATVPLYYENRGEKLKLDNPQINQDIRESIEAKDLDSDQEDKLKRLFAKQYPILTAEKRLRAIAKDVVHHFANRGYKGKAMFVALDKVTAVKMYNFITEEMDLYVTQKEAVLKAIEEPQEASIAKSEIDWIKATEVAVVVSNEQNEISKFNDWGLDIEPHRLKMNDRDLETEFKDEENPFRLAIVCAMWITGFDVPSLSTMYIDKPLKSHTLMQTIARANRVHSGKNNGLLVDYIETYKSLLEALAIYGDSGNKSGKPEAPVKPLEELIEELEEVMSATEQFLSEECGFQLSKIIEEESKLRQLNQLQEAINAIVATDDTKSKFGVLAREVFKKYKALMPDKSIYDFKSKRYAINAIYSVITAKVEQADITYLVKEIQEVVNESIATYDVELEKMEGYGQKIDISGLDFKRIEEEFLKLKGKENIAVQSLKSKIEKKLNRMIDENPLRIDYYERYQEIIDDYNRGKDYKALKEIFDELIVLLTELSEEGQRAEKEELDEEELLIFDLLASNKKISDKEKHKLKDAAKSLLKRLKSKEFKVSQWTEKTQTASQVRKVINDLLYQELPYPTYGDEDINVKTEMLFNEFQVRYAHYGSLVA
jgi:type I restriction enzyme R subunit